MTDTRNPDQTKQGGQDTQSQADQQKREQMQREQGQQGQFEKGQQGQFDKNRQPEQASEKSAIGGGTTKSEELNKDKSQTSPTDR